MGSLHRNGRKTTSGYENHNPNAEGVPTTRVAGMVTASFAQLAVALAPPHAGAPPAPALVGADANMQHVPVLPAHVANALAAAAEIEAAASFEADFGGFVVTKKPIADGLVTAHEWWGEAATARKWDAYAARQNAIAWRLVLEALEPIARAFTVLAARDPTLSARYPALGAFLGARAAEGRKGAAARKKRAPKKAAKAPAANGGATNGH
jgi:hypothetical protein